jgi:hypothetical protein
VLPAHQQARRPVVVAGVAVALRRPPQGGNGPVKVMLITKGHDFSPRERFFAMFDAMGSDITWTHT